ncbi:unnamed protein product, partial [Amoebophrya sp. A120]|eukprot:GSA120T00013457001.1
MDCKNVWVWKVGTCNASFPYLENLYCITNKSRSLFCHAKTQFLMRIAYEKAFWEVVMPDCIRKCFHHAHFSITSFQTQT